MKWISVDERLPNNDTYVLAYIPWFGVNRLNTSNIAFKDTTHWMPLPAPPLQSGVQADAVPSRRCPQCQRSNFNIFFNCECGYHRTA